MSAADYRGSCHCGAVGYAYRTERVPERWPVRCCECSFCRAHGARCTSDPAGSLHFVHAEPEALGRYRFGLRTADFLLCRRCGVYLGARIESDRGAFGLVNLNALAAPIASLPPATPTRYDGETPAARVGRRTRVWTPIAGGAG